jgi:hypothetical protein
MSDSTAFKISGDTLKNLGVAVSIAGTLFGVINFGWSKIAQYDAYGVRIAKLEARDAAVVALTDADRQQSFVIESQRTDLGSLTKRVDALSTDVIQVRVSMERLRTLLETRK